MYENVLSLEKLQRVGRERKMVGLDSGTGLTKRRWPFSLPETRKAQQFILWTKGETWASKKWVAGTVERKPLATQYIGERNLRMKPWPQLTLYVSTGTVHWTQKLPSEENRSRSLLCRVLGQAKLGTLGKKEISEGRWEVRRTLTPQ